MYYSLNLYFFVFFLSSFIFYELLGSVGSAYPNKKKLIPKRGIFLSIWIQKSSKFGFPNKRE
ncbi:hypothetical protein KFK09_028401 [Dendrobium nobile]|uniref:Uncharacterized protein n=1 Tax=Dendrobium nobile TaxID=94219 RepID=A0A8T3A1U4_DENNO|nr:hypothetical protein KFK09_028401 [Dendrobium nobile]